jgi:hypothetical protein
MGLLRGVEHTRLARMQAVGGSGIGIIPIEARVDFSANFVRYSSRFPLEGEHANLSKLDYKADMEWIHFDLAKGKEVNRTPMTSASGLASRAIDPKVTIPVHLQEFFAESPISAWGDEQNFAYAFLKFQGIDLPLQETGSDGKPAEVCKLDAVCILPDESEMLVLHDGFFYDCNLKTQRIRKLPAPEQLSRIIVSLYAIR